MNIKAAVVIFVVLVLSMVLASSADASEGLMELKNNQGGSARCFAVSVLMRDYKYKILLSCRGLVYPAPAGADLFSYVLWVQESGSDKVQKLGEVGVGRGEFSINKPFSQMFITQERDAGVRKPAETVIMQGEVKPIEMLETVQEPKTGETEVGNERIQDNAFMTKGQEVVPTPTVKPSTGGFSIIRVVGGVLLGVIVFVVIIGLISTSRRRPLE